MMIMHAQKRTWAVLLAGRARAVGAQSEYSPGTGGRRAERMDRAVRSQDDRRKDEVDLARRAAWTYASTAPRGTSTNVAKRRSRTGPAGRRAECDRTTRST